jgi:hypothetical protein
MPVAGEHSKCHVSVRLHATITGSGGWLNLCFVFQEKPNQGDSFGEPILIKLNTRGDIINSQHDAYFLFSPHELSGQINYKSGFEHSVVYEHVVGPAGGTGQTTCLRVFETEQPVA